MTEVSNQLMVALDNNAALERFSLSQSVLDHAPVGMVITSADDVVIWANMAMEGFLGISRVELVGSPFFPLSMSTTEGSSQRTLVDSWPRKTCPKCVSSDGLIATAVRVGLGSVLHRHG